jgi:hypothetical protein
MEGIEYDMDIVSMIMGIIAHKNLFKLAMTQPP